MASMNRTKRILNSLRLANSLLSTQIRNATRPTRSPATYLSSPFPIRPSSAHPTNQKLFFSSTPNSVVELVATSDWSTELEAELGSSDLEWTHERVIYIVKKLGKHPQKAFEFFKWVCERDGFKPSSAIYSLILRTLLLKDMTSFWATLKRMKELGFHLDEKTYLTMFVDLKTEKMAREASALSHFHKTMQEENGTDNGAVSAVADVISKTEWSDETEKQLERLVLKDCLSDDLVIRVLRELRYHPIKALKFFDWLGLHREFEHNSLTYNVLARILGQGDSVNEFWGLIERMKNGKFELDLDSYIKISRFLQKKKAIEEAVKLYEFMMDGPYQPLDQDLAFLLQRISAVENPNPSLAFRAANKYESTGRSLSKPAYDGIHRCLTAAAKFDEAEKIVDTMKTLGLLPDNVTYSQLVFGLCKAGRLAEARRVVEEEMPASDCVPDIMTWTILIQGHCNAGEVDQALTLFASMLGKNCQVDAELLEILVKGFLSKGKVVGAFGLVTEMVETVRLKPFQATYKVLIEKLLEARKLEEAMRLLCMMKKHGYPPFANPFVPFIGRFGTVQDAADFLAALSVKEFPTSSAYLHVFEAFFKEGRHHEAKDLLFKCPHHIRKHRDICKLFGSAESKSGSAV